jgi:hypothetical protein
LIALKRKLRPVPRAQMRGQSRRRCVVVCATRQTLRDLVEILKTLSGRRPDSATTPLHRSTTSTALPWHPHSPSRHARGTANQRQHQRWVAPEGQPHQYYSVSLSVRAAEKVSRRLKAWREAFSAFRSLPVDWLSRDASRISDPR